MDRRSESPQDRLTRVEIRVRYPETDQMGVVYHGHYLVWFEIGRTELMREAGCPYGELESRDGVFFPVVDLRARYHASARYDEKLLVEARIEEIGGASVRFGYRILRAGNGRLLATGQTTHAAVGRDGKPMRLPLGLAARLAEGVGSK